MDNTEVRVRALYNHGAPNIQSDIDDNSLGGKKQEACCSIWPISELSGKALHFEIAKSGRCFIQVINRRNIANRSFTHLLNALSTLSTSLNLLAQGGRCQSAFLFFVMTYLRKTIWLPSGNFEA